MCLMKALDDIFRKPPFSALAPSWLWSNRAWKVSLGGVPRLLMPIFTVFHVHSRQEQVNKIHPDKRSYSLRPRRISMPVHTMSQDSSHSYAAVEVVHMVDRSPFHYVVAVLCPILLFVECHDYGIFPLLRHPSKILTTIPSSFRRRAILRQLIGDSIRSNQPFLSPTSGWRLSAPASLAKLLATCSRATG